MEPSYGNFLSIQKEKTREQNEEKGYMLQNFKFPLERFEKYWLNREGPVAYYGNIENKNVLTDPVRRILITRPFSSNYFISKEMGSTSTNKDIKARIYYRLNDSNENLTRTVGRTTAFDSRITNTSINLSSKPNPDHLQRRVHSSSETASITLTPDKFISPSDLPISKYEQSIYKPFRTFGSTIFSKLFYANTDITYDITYQQYFLSYNETESILASSDENVSTFKQTKSSEATSQIIESSKVSEKTNSFSQETAQEFTHHYLSKSDISKSLRLTHPFEESAVIFSSSDQQPTVLYSTYSTREGLRKNHSMKDVKTTRKNEITMSSKAKIRTKAFLPHFQKKIDQFTIPFVRDFEVTPVFRVELFNGSDSTAFTKDSFSWFFSNELFYSPKSDEGKPLTEKNLTTEFNQTGVEFNLTTLLNQKHAKFNLTTPLRETGANFNFTSLKNLKGAEFNLITPFNHKHAKFSARSFRTGRSTVNETIGTMDHTTTKMIQNARKPFKERATGIHNRQDKTGRTEGKQILLETNGTTDKSIHKIFVHGYKFDTFGSTKDNYLDNYLFFSEEGKNWTTYSGENKNILKHQLDKENTSEKTKSFYASKSVITPKIKEKFLSSISNIAQWNSPSYSQYKNLQSRFPPSYNQLPNEGYEQKGITEKAQYINILFNDINNLIQSTISGRQDVADGMRQTDELSLDTQNIIKIPSSAKISLKEVIDAKKTSKISDLPLNNFSKFGIPDSTGRGYDTATMHKNTEISEKISSMESNIFHYPVINTTWSKYSLAISSSRKVKETYVQASYQQSVQLSTTMHPLKIVSTIDELTKKTAEIPSSSKGLPNSAYLHWKKMSAEWDEMTSSIRNRTLTGEVKFLSKGFLVLLFLIKTNLAFFGFNH